jgi:hypothetical protein
MVGRVAGLRRTLLPLGDGFVQAAVDDRGVRPGQLGRVAVTANLSTPLMKLANGS